MTRNLTYSITLLLLVTLSLGLGACGGGGGSSSGSASSGAPKGLSYGSLPISLLLGGPIDPLIPQVGGGAVTDWSVTPSLPAGLSLNSTSGVITGTPTTLSPSQIYTVKATNTQGQTSTELELAVVSPATAVYVSCGDGTVASFSLDARTGQTFPHGWGQNPSVFATAETVSVLPSGKALYAPLLGDAVNNSALLTYSIGNDGRLEAIETTTIGPGIHDLAVGPEGEVVYLTSSKLGLLSSYGVDPATGLLTLAGSLSVGVDPVTVVVAPSRTAAFTANKSSASITTIPLDSSTGMPLGTTLDFSLNGGEPSALATDPEGRLLLATLENFDLLVALVVDQATGSLTVVGTTATGPAPVAVTVAPGGKHVLVINGGDASLSSFALDPTTGTLTPQGSPLTLGGDPRSIVLDPSGSFAFITDRASSELILVDRSKPSAPEILGRRRTRATPLGIDLGTGGRPTRPRTRNLYAVNIASASINSFAVAPDDGDLTELSAPLLVDAQPSALSMDPFGRFAWVSSVATDSVQPLQIDAGSGDLSITASPTPCDADPSGIDVDPGGHLLFVVSPVTDRITSYAIDSASGELSLAAIHATGTDPGAVSVDPTGQFVVTANRDSGDLTILHYDQTGSFVSQLTGAAASSNVTHLSWSRDGSHLYATAKEQNRVDVYFLDPQVGLTLVGEGSAPDAPRAFLVHPTLDRAYAALAQPGDGGLGVYSLDDQGIPTYQTTRTGVGLTPVALAIDPAGGFLFSANLNGDDIARFTLNAKGGPTFAELTPAGDGPLILGLREVVQ